MVFAQNMAQWHLLMWVVPALLAVLCSAIGKHLSRPVLLALCLSGVSWPLLQALSAGVWFLWGGGQATPPLTLDVPGGQGLFALVFALDGMSNWAVALASALSLLALVQALDITRFWIGRHRYYALVLLVGASANLLFTARSMLAVLFGWEAVALAGTFAAGFWEPEEGRARTGLRWLVFQHIGTVCLVVVWLVHEAAPLLAAILLVCACAIRLGLPPFHGWVPEHSRSPSSALALVHSVASLLAGIYLLQKSWSLLVPVSWIVHLLYASVGAAVLAGVLAAWLPGRPATALAWLFVAAGGLLTMVQAAGDAAAVRLLLTGLAPALAGAVLSLGGVVDWLESRDVPRGTPPGRALVWLVAALAGSLAIFPAISALALGRALLAFPAGTMTWVGVAAAGLFLVAAGRVLAGLAGTLAADLAQRNRAPARHGGLLGAGWLAAGAGPLLGLALLVSHSFSGQIFGGGKGLAWGVALGAGLVLGWLSGWFSSGPSWKPAMAGRLVGRAASSGLVLGELVVRLPVVLLRMVGVLVWRLVGDFLLDTVLVGTAVGTIEGVGAVTRLIQNGRVQRYAFVLLVLVLVLVMVLRG